MCYPQRVVEYSWVVVYTGRMIVDRPQEYPLECSVCRRVVYIPARRRFTAKYCSKKCMTEGMIGHKPFHWKGGRIVHKGYVMVLKKGHPNGDRDGYVPEHRLVMEESIGRYLDPKEVVHHLNGVRGDNRITNLELLASQGEHMSSHHHAGRQFTSVATSETRM